MTRLPRALLLALALLATTTGTVAAASLQPLNLQVDKGSDWDPDNDFRLAWERLEGVPPAHAAWLRIWDTSGNVVIPALGFPWDGPIQNVRAPARGRYIAEVWLEDSAGNTGPSASVSFAFDDTPPGLVQLWGPTGWVTPEDATVWPEPSAPLPVSGIRGYAFSVDRGLGSTPCAGPVRCEPAEVKVAGGASSFSPGTLPEGVNVVRVLAVSGSGVPSPAASSAIVRVDGSAPAVTLEAPEAWVNAPQQVVARATDALSGMAGGSIPPFTAIAVDGSLPRLGPGATVTATVSGEGVHRVTSYARDAAGNSGEGRPAAATVRIDETPPRVAFANVQDPAEPERIEATIGDSLSGVDPERGSIGVRPAGSHQRFQPLPTVVANGRLLAHWDSDAFAPGNYEFRASAYDRAGNAGGSERRASGERMVLANPLKTPARIVAGFGGRLLVWQRCTRREDRRRCRREEIERFEARPTARAIPYGRGVSYSGRLTTSGDTGLADLTVAVVESFGAGAPPAQRTTLVRTAADGSFTLRLAPGPSRRIEVLLGGTRTLTRAGSGAVELDVQAGVRMHPSSAMARIGGAPVVFRGRLADPATVPAGGLPVELQFRLPGREWSEFRTVQSDGSGRFRYAYSFSDDDSRGIRFQFRAFVPSAAGWPYEAASSRPVFVTGR
ncbi:MAG TPA: hypothetical protein VFX85_09525 [Solirubrobacterales bacterium]|nr:hypothetical protein [Solirubrobacterales bacterium]